MKTNAFSIQILFCLLFIGGLSNAFAQAFDISSGGAPTITGALGGSVTGSSSVITDLAVTINFGQVSPINTNNIVKVILPISIRSNTAYKVTATVTGTTNANLQAIQETDIGFGENNLRAMGNRSEVCNDSDHIFYAPFDNDPASNLTINAVTGRTQYPSTLSNIGVSTTIMSGPRLTQGSMNRATNNGYIFDAIFAITPQFYAAGTTSMTITFTISAGPNVPC
jgi:hypothetical protein